jgi:hypothetical protein
MKFDWRPSVKSRKLTSRTWSPRQDVIGTLPALVSVLCRSDWIHVVTIAIRRGLLSFS